MERSATYSDQDLDVLAKTIYGEARGESSEGQIAVGWCIRHRADLAAQTMARTGKRHPIYGDGSIAAVCLAPMQFSCWNKNDPNCALLRSEQYGAADIRSAMHAAKGVLAGVLSDRLPETTHYLAPTGLPKLSNGAPKYPAWVKTATFAGSIGRHRFYRNVR